MSNEDITRINMIINDLESSNNVTLQKDAIVIKKLQQENEQLKENYKSIDKAMSELMEDKELFIQYHELKKEYTKAKFDYDKALDKKVEYLYSVLPGASNAESDLIKGSVSDKLLNYTIKMEEIEKEITVRRNLMDNLSYRLKLKELELKDSENMLDKIYLLKYVKNIKVRYICTKTNYSKTQVYRYLEEIQNNIKMGQNGKIDMVY